MSRLPRSRKLTLGKKSSKYYSQFKTVTNEICNEVETNTDLSLQHDNCELLQPVAEPSVPNKISRCQKTLEKSVQTSISHRHIAVQVASKQRNVSIQHPPCNRGIRRQSVISCLRLCDNPTISKFVDKLESCNQLKLFEKLICSISTGNLRTDNQSWITLLDLAKYSNCKSTTNMVYSPQSVEFWAVIYLLFGQSALNVFRGPANFGKVVSEMSPRGFYNPKDAKINFAVPSIKTLKKLSTGYAKEIKPGFVTHTLDVAEQESKIGKQYTLSFDGKKVGEGSRGESDGDIDLLGREKPQSISEAIKQRDHFINSAELINIGLKHVNHLRNHKVHLNQLLVNISNCVKKLRLREEGQFFLQKRIEKLSANNPDKKKSYQFSLSRVHMHTHKCDNAIKRSLALNHDLLKLMYECNSPNGSFASCNFIQINLQPNMFHLMPPDHQSRHIDLELNEHSSFIKRHTKLWQRKREEACVTGSTLAKALGLETLNAQKDHVLVHVKRTVKLKLSGDEEAQMKFSRHHQKHAIATLVSSLMPALLPLCMYFFETGCFFIDGNEKEKLIAVSPDGMIICVCGPNCSNHTNHPKKIVVEVKCICPNDKLPNAPFYEIPHLCVPELLAEMASCEASCLWLLSYTVKSVSLLKVHFDAILWERILFLCDILYGSTNITIQTRLNPESKSLRQDVKQFVETNGTFICEAPSLLSSEPIPKAVHVSSEQHFSPFGETGLPQEQQTPIKQIESDSKTCCVEAKLIINECHQVMRQQASEVCVFMLNDKDRIHDANVPHCSPVAYGLKGQSMSNEDLRYMVNKVRNELHQRSIPILVEIYDGQWQNLVMHSEDGFPLNLLQLARLTWNRISKMKKEKLLEEMTSTCKIKQGDKDLLQFQRISNNTMLMNVQCQRLNNGGISLTSLGGNLFPCPVAQFFLPVLTASVWSQKDVLMSENETMKPAGKQLGLRSHERNLLCALNQDILDEIGDLVEAHVADEEFDDDTLPDLDGAPSLLEQSLTTQKFNILQSICKELRELDQERWGWITPDHLYPNLLTSSEQMMETFFMKDLKVIAGVLEHVTGRLWFTSQLRKAGNVNMLVKAFGSNDFVTVTSHPVIKMHNPKTLQLICRNSILSDEYPTLSLQASYARVVHCVNHSKWMSKLRIPPTLPIPVNDDEVCHMPIFCYPEFSEERGQLEPRTLDSAHILNNMRSHLCRNGYDYCSRTHYQALATEKPHIISRAVVFDHIDPQNVFISMRFFGEEVTSYFSQRGWHKSASFVRLVRNWYKACDMRGLPADTRVRALYELHAFLTDEIDFHKFPFPISGTHYKGMPLTTYEALLQNICTRIYLYSQAHGRTYNPRSVTTLSNESFFSDLVRLEKEGNGYPKACNVSRIMGRVVTLNYYKHKPDKYDILKLPYIRAL